jgi:hypothetical protein
LESGNGLFVWQRFDGLLDSRRFMKRISLRFLAMILSMASSVFAQFPAKVLDPNVIVKKTLCGAEGGQGTVFPDEEPCGGGQLFYE